jgi:TonB family protein
MADPLPKMPSQSEGANRLPAKIGRYEVLEKLGSGGSGTVYKATDPFIGRILAIKTFRVDLLPGAQRDRFLQRFYHEARISGGLSHPNIVALFDVGEMDGLPYLVFEYVDGPPLDIALARQGRLDAAETIRVVEQAAAALDFAHARGIVHRDIRPANIILATDRRVRIADFGIARVEGSQLTQHGEVLGTPAYMSPEQIRGYDLSPSSDLFSLAVSAYEMLSGQRPFDGKNQAELLEALVYSPPTEPKELRSLGIPSREFMFVFERALAKDPAHRFADGASFARALKSCLGVVTASADAIPVTRIAVPEGPLPAPIVLPPPAAPEPEPPPAPVAKKAFPPSVSLSDPQSASIDTSATASIEGGSGGPSVEAGPKFISSSDATLISTAKTEPGVRPVPAAPAPPPEASAEETLISTVGFEKALKAEPPPIPETTTIGFQEGLKASKPPVLSSSTVVTSAPPAASRGSSDATMITPRAPDDSDSTMVGDADADPPPTQRLSREAVESLLARSHSGQSAEARSTPSPILQKTQPGSEAAPLSSSGSGIEVPPTQHMPRLQASPPLQPSARESTASKPSFTLEDMMRNAAAKQAAPPVKEAEQTIVMSDTERVAAAKPRVPERSAQKVPVAPPISKPASAPPAPNLKSASRASASAASFSSSNPSGPQNAVATRPSAVPKVAIGVGLLILLGVAIGAVVWGMGGSTNSAAVETWNDLTVFPESAVEKPPSLLSSQDFPRMELEPGTVVSVTVSWIVTPEGLVEDPKITESTASAQIDAVVIEAVRKWRYEAGQKDGKAVPVRVLPRRYTFPQRGSGG